MFQRMGFQYISCCSLSYRCQRYWKDLLAFQYISCCSLSHFKSIIANIFISFNTSHVVVYHYENGGFDLYNGFQYISCCSLSLSIIKTPLLTLQVSIHLMLQFIFIPDYNTLFIYAFQYISCCSLSSGRSGSSGKNELVSIHLMLQFIL